MKNSLICSHWLLSSLLARLITLNTPCLSSLLMQKALSVCVIEIAWKRNWRIKKNYVVDKSSWGGHIDRTWNYKCLRTSLSNKVLPWMQGKGVLATANTKKSHFRVNKKWNHFHLVVHFLLFKYNEIKYQRYTDSLVRKCSCSLENWSRKSTTSESS